MSFTCFGEILWDVFPDRRHLGGAPLNVAYYLNQLGNNTQLISAVGLDELGDEALKIIDASGLPTTSITRVADKETGQVIVSLDERGSAEYKFKPDAAWDYIDLPTTSLQQTVDHTLVFGSLAGRSKHNLNTLDTLIEHAQCRVFDLNLRPPFDDLNLIVELMQKAEIVKMNDDELALLCQHLHIDVTDLAAQLSAVLQCCAASSICVTQGSKGAVLIHNGKFYSHQGYPSQVIDTVGAGDAFLAGLISELAKSNHAERALSVACAIGSLVAAQAGAQSPINQHSMSKLIG